MRSKTEALGRPRFFEEYPKNLAPHVWYVAFAPAENPQVAVAVVVEDGGDPNNLAATGGLVAAPIGRAVIAAALGKASR